MRKRNCFLILLLILMPIVIAACSGNPAKESAPTEEQVTAEQSAKAAFRIEDIPLIDGSTSTFPLRKYLVCDLFGLECVRTVSALSSSSIAQFDIVPVFDTTDDFDLIEKGNFIQAMGNSGTHGSYLNLLSGNKHLIIVGREPSESELRIASEKGLEIVAEPIALDALVLILNAENKVEGMTLEETGKIFAGKILNWQELGGGDQTIVPFHRNLNSASRELMDNIVMAPQDLKYSGDILDHQILNTTMMPIDTVSSNPAGIAYTVYYFEKYMAPSKFLKIIPIDGIAPSTETIQSGEYPLVTGVYIATLASLQENTNASQMKKWLLSEQGQEIIEKSGYVPIAGASEKALDQLNKH